MQQRQISDDSFDRAASERKHKSLQYKRNNRGAKLRMYKNKQNFHLHSIDILKNMIICLGI